MKTLEVTHNVKHSLKHMKEFEISRNGLQYGVTVKKHLTHNQVEKLKVIVLSKEDNSDHDYLIIPYTNHTPRSLEDYLTHRIRVITQVDPETNKSRIESLALAAEVIK